MAQGAGSSSVTRRWSYDVFLSFRGKDTRLNFVGHLHGSLRQRGIHTFIDDESLDAGKEIRPSLFEAIKESRIAIIIFSQDYATSTFCLDELVQIIECFKEENRLVCPVFYHVDPSDVRHQTGSYGQALADLQNRSGIKDEKLRKWRWALTQAADLSGWHIQGSTKEQELIKMITRKVSAEINPNHLNVADYPVGLGLRVQEVISLLNLWSNKEAEMVGICGIGGIGKSTIARAVYNSVADNFDDLCFLSNVREISSKHGLPHLQEILLYKLVGEKKLRLGDFNEGIPIIKNRLQNKKILLILDDVDEVEQLWALAGSCEWFGPGSRIIITTRNKQLLASLGIQKIYYVEVLNADDSLQLIERHAFKNLRGDLDHYKDVLNRAIKYSGGLPLSLIMIGSNLCGKKADDWASALNVYEQKLGEKVFEVLKVSYDALSREEYKEIFLDLACFFNGEKLGDVINMLMSFRGVDPTHAINVLMDKSLIKIKEDCVRMHDLIEDMGKEIVRQQSKEPSKRNRLWCYEDILHILQNDTGTDEIEVIILDLPKDKEIQWKGEAFTKMNKLKVLVIKNASFSEGIKYLPNSLCVLEWKGYPFMFLPSNFHPTKLVHLDLSNSCVVLQPFNKKLESLSRMNFSNCKSLSQIPNLSRVPNLTELQLDGCTNLIEIHDSLGFLHKLKRLSAMRCKNLRTLPPSIKLTSLEQLNLFGCSSLESFPEISDRMEKLKTLDLESTAIEKLPFSICNLVGLESLNMDACCNLKQLPASICMLPNLLELTTNFCEGMKHFKKCNGRRKAISDCSIILTKGKEKEDNSTASLRKHFHFSNCNLTNESLALCLSCIPDIVHLDLKFNSITTLPACIEECANLRYLLLDHCVQLEKIMRMPPKLETFSAVGCTSLSKSSGKTVLDQAFYFGNGKRNFVLPGKRIPQRLDFYSRGSSMSFWIRDKFPKIALWFLVENDQVDRYKCAFSVHINDTKLDISSQWLSLSTIVPNHIYICDMESIIKKVELCHADRWNQVKVSIKSNTQQVIMDKEICMAIHAYRQQNDFKDIRFKDPRIYLDCNSWQEVQQSPQDWEELADEMNEDSKSTKFAGLTENITRSRKVAAAAGFVDRASLSTIFQVALQKLASSDITNYFQSRNLKDSLPRRLYRTLISLNLVLDDAEKRQYTKPNVKKWLDELDHAVYVANDLLDEIATEATKLKIEHDSQTVTSKVWGFFTAFVNLFDKQIESRTQQVLDDLTFLERQSDVLGLKRRSGDSSELVGFRTVSKRFLITPPAADECGIYGRDGDKEKIIQFLLLEHRSRSPLSVVSIVGRGGLGKTTLAQLVYNDARIEDHFQLKAWVCISEEFDVVGITQTILYALGCVVTGFEGLKELQLMLMEKLEGKKFFLVLDDIWHESGWEAFKVPFSLGTSGNKILVTTRSKNVPLVVGSSRGYKLWSLNNEDGWKLCADYAFRNKDDIMRTNLESIGKKIVKKCKGLPLAIKILGGLLHTKSSENQWNEILNCAIWQLSDDLVPALRLGYHYLPSNLKRCVAFCSMFACEENLLIRRWKAKNVVLHCHQGNENVEEMGNQILAELESRSFLQKSTRRDKYIMHDLINDLAKEKYHLDFLQ